MKSLLPIQRRFARWTDEDRASAVLLAKKIGRHKTAYIYGVHPDTVSKWKAA